jgi:hypothetical protein
LFYNIELKERQFKKEFNEEEEVDAIPLLGMY